MRSKAPLVLMEQMVMLLVFAWAATLCLQAFVQADESSRRLEARDHAVILAQSAAETIRAAKGDFAQAAQLLGTDCCGQDFLMVNYAADWTPAEDAIRYTLEAARLECDIPGLEKAGIWVRDEASEEAEAVVFRLEVAWQGEAAGYG